MQEPDGPAGPEPRIDERGVPFCFRPSSICEPAVAELTQSGATLGQSAASELAAIVRVAMDAGWTGEEGGELAAWLRDRLAEAVLVRVRAVDGTLASAADLVWAPSAEDLYRAGHEGGALKRCPFCGSWPLSTREVNRQNGNVVIRISCPGKRLTPCSFMVSCHKPENEQRGRDDLYARWNARSAFAGRLDISRLRRYSLEPQGVHTVSAIATPHGMWVKFEDLSNWARAAVGSGTLECTGLAASWCPVCGDCTCSQNREVQSDAHDDPQCPLHGEASRHAEEER